MHSYIQNIHIYRTEHTERKRSYLVSFKKHANHMGTLGARSVFAGMVYSPHVKIDLYVLSIYLSMNLCWSSFIPH